MVRRLMRRLLTTFLVLAQTFLLFPLPARAQQTVFVPSCSGTNDTAAFSALISAVGSNAATIRLPFKKGTRCAVNSLTIPSNVTLDNSDGTGIKVNTGQTLTIVGPVVNPPGKQIFYNATAGQGTVSFSGNSSLVLAYPAWWGTGASAKTAARTAALTASAVVSLYNVGPNAVNVATCATGGSGTPASPWTGWNNNGDCVWSGRAYYFGGLADGTPGVYRTTSSVINWSYGGVNGTPTSKGIWIEGNNATIECAGTGLRCITIQSANDSNPTWLRSIRVQNLKVRNTGSWAEGLYISGNLGSVYESLDIAWFTDKNFHFRGVVQDHFNLINSYPEPGEPTTAYPIWIANDLLSSDNEFLGLNAVQATGASIYVGLCQNSLFTGTGEANGATGGLGLICNTDCRSNTFKMDNEGNELGGTGRDFSVDGHNNVFLSTMSTGVTRLTSHASENLFLGGLFNSIQIDAGARSNEFRSVRYNIFGTGTFVDNGTNTKYSACNFLLTTSCKVNDTTAFRPDGVNLQSEHEVFDGAQLSGGTVTVTMDASVAFATTGYTCSLTNVTAPRALQFTPLSGSQFRVDGTGTDSFTYRCKGH
jgi:hypothetical protein